MTTKLVVSELGHDEVMVALANNPVLTVLAKRNGVRYDGILDTEGGDVYLSVSLLPTPTPSSRSKNRIKNMCRGLKFVKIRSPSGVFTRF